MRNQIEISNVMLH